MSLDPGARVYRDPGCAPAVEACSAAILIDMAPASRTGAPRAAAADWHEQNHAPNNSCAADYAGRLLGRLGGGAGASRAEGERPRGTRVGRADVCAARSSRSATSSALAKLEHCTPSGRGARVRSATHVVNGRGPAAVPAGAAARSCAAAPRTSTAQCAPRMRRQAGRRAGTVSTRGGRRSGWHRGRAGVAWVPGCPDAAKCALGASPQVL